MIKAILKIFQKLKWQKGYTLTLSIEPIAKVINNDPCNMVTFSFYDIFFKKNNHKSKT